LGYLEEAFHEEFLVPPSDPLEKAIYLFLHALFLCNGEKPLRIDFFQNFLNKALKRLINDHQLHLLENNLEFILEKWCSRKKRLLPPQEFEHYGFKTFKLQPVYHKEWATSVLEKLYNQSKDSNFTPTIDRALQTVFPDEYILWEELDYERKSEKFLNWLVASVQFFEDDLTRPKELHLDYNNLKTLPDSIGKLSSLIILNLNGNQFKTLPESLAKLGALEILDLRSNKFEILPAVINKLKKLKALWLEYNALSTLPESIGQLSSLKTLSVFSNQITTLPESISKLSSLETLDLGFNKLDAPLDFIGSLFSLKELFIRYSRLKSPPGTHRQS